MNILSHLEVPSHFLVQYSAIAIQRVKAKEEHSHPVTASETTDRSLEDAQPSKTLEPAGLSKVATSNQPKNKAENTLPNKAVVIRNTQRKQFKPKGVVSFQEFRKGNKTIHKEEELISGSRAQTFLLSTAINSIEQYVANLPEQRFSLHKKMMEGRSYTMTNETRLETTVLSEKEYKLLEEVSLPLVNHLRDTLKNDQIELNILLKEEEISRDTPLSKDILARWKTEHPSFSFFLKEFDVDIL